VKGKGKMSSVVFLSLFVALCGWLDARIVAAPAPKGATPKTGGR